MCDQNSSKKIMFVDDNSNKSEKNCIVCEKNDVILTCNLIVSKNNYKIIEENI
jgi:hypothetical protein